MKRTAKFIKELDGWTGEARLYKVTPPTKYDELEEGETTDFVVVSATFAAFSGSETYIFPSDSEGNVLDWGELPGSFRGEHNHKRALINAGYSVI